MADSSKIRRTRVGTTVLTLLLLCRAGAQAQTVAGTVRDDAGRPVAAAFVIVSAEQRRIAAVLSDSAGRYQLTTPRPGSYTLHVERVGFATTPSATLELSAGATTRHDVTLAPQAIALGEIRVSKERGCVVRPREGLQTARVWEEARKALSVVSWSQHPGSYRFDAVRFSRERDPHTLRVLRDSITERYTSNRRPFAGVNARKLAERGFFEATDSGSFFFAPDAEVITSDPFLDTHCFRLSEHSERADLIGLTFAPARGRRLPDVRGTLWLNRNTGGLEFLDYEYVQAPTGVIIEGAGGRIDFERLPTGAWIVRRWYVRMPIATYRQISLFGSSRRELQVQRLQDDGGEIVRIYDTRGAEIRPAAVGSLAGVLSDSATHAPIRGARIRVSGIDEPAVTDSLGAFTLRAITAGPHLVAVETSGDAQLQILRAPPVEVNILEGEQTHVELHPPSLASLAASLCAERRNETVVAVGHVDQPRATINLAWSAWGVTEQTGRATVTEQKSVAIVTADGNGDYYACDIPVRTVIAARILQGEAVVAEVSARTAEEALVLLPPLHAPAIAP